MCIILSSEVLREQLKPRFGHIPDYYEYTNAEGTKTINMPGRISVNDGNAYIGTCLAGLGIIQVPKLFVQKYLDNDTLLEIFPDHPPEPMPVTILYAQRRHLPRRVQVFITWLEQILQIN